MQTIKIKRNEELIVLGRRLFHESNENMCNLLAFLRELYEIMHNRLTNIELGGIYIRPLPILFTARDIFIVYLQIIMELNENIWKIASLLSICRTNVSK